MNKGIYQVITNEQLTETVFRLSVAGDTQAIQRPGQFANIAIDGFYLRRPISVCDYDSHSITFVYKVVGEGTQTLTRYTKGSSLDIIVGLGNGFDTEVNCRKPLVVGGGVGIPPLYRLTKELVAKDKKPTAILCFNTASEIFLHNEFAKLGIEVAVATIDGSYGTKGFYSDAIVRHNIEYDYYYTCGPQPMLRSIHATLDVEGQISFEERMGCGFGGCMGCSHKTRSGYKRVCTDTILKSEEVIFDEH